MAPAAEVVSNNKITSGKYKSYNTLSKKGSVFFMEIGLALSGGGSKGAFHIGVIKALVETGIKIEYISGTSSGSIIASLFAMGYTPDEISKMFVNYCSKMFDVDKLLPFKILSCFVSSNLCIKGICKGKNLEKTLEKYGAKRQMNYISDLKVNIAIPTVDVNTGEVIYFMNNKLNGYGVYKDDENYENGDIEEKENLYDDIPTYYEEGKICEIVRASCSLPGIFVPKKINGHILIDGGVRQNLPVRILKKMGAKKIIAVTFDENKNRVEKYSNILSITMQAFDIMSHEINERELKLADIVIRPKIKELSLLGCDKINKSIEDGYNETLKIIDKIKK